MGVGRLIDTEAVWRTRGAAGAACALACVLAGLWPAATRAEVPSSVDAKSVATDGPVYAIARAGGRTFLGGDFDHAGPRTGPGVPFSLDDASLRPYPEVAGGEVDAVLPDGAGGWYVGGSFQYVGGTPRANLAHIGADGSLDPGFVPNPNGAVHALKLDTLGSTRSLYVGGHFTRIGGQGHSALAALDPATGVPQTFNADEAQADNSPGTVDAIDVVHATNDVTTGNPPHTTQTEMPLVVIGGDFAKIGTKPVNGLGAVWGVGAVESSPGNDPINIAGAPASNSNGAWSPACASSCHIRAVALGAPKTVTDSTNTRTLSVAVYAGGDFANHLDAWRLQITESGTNAGAANFPSAYSGWMSAAPDDVVRAIVLVPQPSPAPPLLIIGGDFASLGSTPRHHLAELTGIADPSSASAPAATIAPWHPDAECAPTPCSPDVRTVAVTGGAVVVGGNFTSVGGQPRNGVAKLGIATGSADPAWDPGLAGGPTNAVAADGSSAYAGGAFSTAHAVERHGLVALNADGSIDQGWRADATCSPDPCSAAVRSLLVDDGGVFAGGDFTSVSGLPREHLTSLDSANGSVRPFAPDPDGPVLALAKTDVLYVGGAFRNIGGQPRDRIAAVDPGTGAPTAFADGAGGDDVVRALDASCSTVYAGGSFTAIGDQSRGGIAALDPGSGRATPWNPQANSTVLAIRREGNLVYAGGSFWKIGGAIRQKIAALDAGSGIATRFNPAADDQVRSITTLDGAVYAGGAFLNIGNAARSHLAALDPVTGDATGWAPPVDGPVDALTSAGSALAAGGEFHAVGAVGAAGYAPFGPPSDTAAPTSCGASTPPPGGGNNDVPPAPTPSDSPSVSTPPDQLPTPTLPAGSTPRRLRIAGLRVTGNPPTLRVNLSVAATVRILLARRVPAHAARYVPAGAMTRKGKAGANRFQLHGPHGAPLRPGRYRATVIATGADRRSVRRIVDFRLGGRRGR
jgi:trimeric autotransporter adhesin